MARNHLVEAQFSDAELLARASEAGRRVRLDRNGTCTIWLDTDRQLSFRARRFSGKRDRTNAGTFAGWTGVTSIQRPWVMQCCTGNGTQGLYYAWEGIVRCRDGKNAQVNLLLNRASPWLDVDSYLPYEGKAVIKNKTAQRISIRIPSWIDRRSLRLDVNGQREGRFGLGTTSSSTN